MPGVAAQPGKNLVAKIGVVPPRREEWEDR